MWLVYSLSKHSRVWLQGQRLKQNQPLLNLGISGENFAATGGGKRIGLRAKGCGRTLSHFFMDSRMKANKGQKGITHFISAPVPVQHFDLKRQLRGWLKKISTTKVKISLSFCCCPLEIWLEIWLSGRKSTRFIPPPLQRGTDHPTICLLPTKYYLHVDTKL